MKSKVYVVGRDSSVVSMFRERGFDVLSGDLPNDSVDFVCFTGGSDWSPHLYGEENIASHCNPGRDTFEWEVYWNENILNLPKVGICRGGQLFTFTNGGKLIQDIPGHGSRSHFTYEGDNDGQDGVRVLSCHHQAMVPDPVRLNDGRAQIVSVAQDGINEVVWFPERKELAFQSHPEWGDDETTDYFFELMSRFKIAA
jgi:putative glutamine amidotransferase